MAFAATTLNEVAPPRPYTAAVVADRYVGTADYRNSTSTPGNVPSGTIAVMDAVSGTAQGWKGSGYYAWITASSHAFWVISHDSVNVLSSIRSVRTLFRLVPSTGTTSSFTLSGLATHSAIETVGTQIWVADRSSVGTRVPIERLDTTTSTWLSTYSDPGSDVDDLVYDGTNVYAMLPTKIVRINPSTGTQTSLTPTGYQRPAGVKCFHDAGRIWWHVFNKTWIYDIAGNTMTNYASTTGHAFGGFDQDPVSGHLYAIINATDKLLIFDPVTMSYGTETLTADGTRYFAKCAGGKLWIAAGKPYTR